MKRLLHSNQNYLLCLLAMFFLQHASAQDIVYVTPGTGLTITPGTSFTMDLLTFTPSSNFTIDDMTVTRNTTITHPASNTYISRVYTFSSTTPTFSGDIQMGYQDGAELNGLDESTLQLNVYDGANWQPFVANTNNTVSNYVLTTGFSNFTLNEMTLAGTSAPLPLLWGKMSAYRQSGQVFIDWGTLQENNVGHFNIEKSFDGRSWSSILRNIPATNLSLPQEYHQADPVYSPDKLFYRIQEVDLDGQSSFSNVVAVSAEGSRNTLVIFPNPVGNRFYISGDNVAGLRQVQLLSASGILLKTWAGAQDGYAVDLPAAGVYYVRLTRSDGSVQYETLVKK